jgi:hypothetical protein
MSAAVLPSSGEADDSDLKVHLSDVRDASKMAREYASPWKFLINKYKLFLEILPITVVVVVIRIILEQTIPE